MKKEDIFLSFQNLLRIFSLVRFFSFSSFLSFQEFTKDLSKAFFLSKVFCMSRKDYGKGFESIRFRLGIKENFKELKSKDP